jgi:ketosteroid isomerase-like protein
MATLSARFVSALRALENELDLQPLVQLCSDDCEITNPLWGGGGMGGDAARRYWRQYLDRFQVVRTEFRSQVDGQSASALEWISSANLPDGHPVEFSGVTILLSKDSRITAMHVYFDPRPLLVTARTRKSPTPIRTPRDDVKTA